MFHLTSLVFAIIKDKIRIDILSIILQQTQRKCHEISDGALLHWNQGINGARRRKLPLQNGRGQEKFSWFTSLLYKD
jgi:hypothetical protein